MDPGTIAVSIPVVAIIAGAAVKIAQIRAKDSGGGGPAFQEVMNRVAALEDELGTVRHELAEAQERLDFAERLLAKPQDPRPPAPS